MRVDSMAALGSSFAAGPGLPPVVDRGAMRSGCNYAHLTAAALGARLLDATVSGATTDTILRTGQRIGFTRVPPQIQALDPSLDLDLVTITAGGNDVGYLGGLLTTALAALLSRPPVVGASGRALRARNPKPVTDGQARVGRRFPN